MTSKSGDKKMNAFFQKLATEFAGFLIGVQILLKALDKMKYFSQYPAHVCFLFAAGLFVIAGSIFNAARRKESGHAHALFHIVEGVVIITSALILFEEGKFRMPAFLAFIGCLYVMMGMIGYKLNKDNYKQYGKSILRWVGSAFLVFGFTAVIWNWNYDKDKWVFGIGGMFILIGALYAFFAGRLISIFERAEKSKAPEVPKDN